MKAAALLASIFVALLLTGCMPAGDWVAITEGCMTGFETYVVDLEGDS
ncbi:MAG: hypothetical protein R3248_13055 [Candidatus Promineifilaceae bacterium]|nr:hypothetical protein [Candidatus Promineifilaceae bacterium]